MVLGYNLDKNRNIKRATIQGTQFTNMGRLWGSLGSMNPTPAPATSSMYVLFNHQPEARGHPSALPGFPILGLREHSETHPTPFLTLSQKQVMPPPCSLPEAQPSAPYSQQPHDPSVRRSRPALQRSCLSFPPALPKQSF